MKKIGKWLCLLFVLCSSFCLSININHSSKASMVHPTPPDGGGSCGETTYYEASFTDPRLPDESIIKNSKFRIEPNWFEETRKEDFNLDNLLNYLDNFLYFYEVTVDTCAGTTSYEIIWRDYNPIDFKLDWSNDDNWQEGKFGVYNFTANLTYKKNQVYSAVAQVSIYEDYSDIIYIDGIKFYETTATKKLDIQEILNNIEVKALDDGHAPSYTYEDQYSNNYSEVGVHHVIITAELVVEGVTYTQELYIEINVKDDIGPIFNDNLNQIIVSNTVILKPQALFNFLDLEDNYDSRDKLEIQVVKNTYEFASLELGEYEFVLIAKDSSGNFSEEKKIKVIVVDDILLPVAITNTNLVLSNIYLESDSLAHVVAYVNGFSSRPYSYKLDNEDYKSTQYSHDVIDRASQVDVEFTFNDESTTEKSLLFKTISENNLSNNVNSNEYNSNKNKLIRLLKMLWEFLLVILEKLFGWLV